MLFSTRFAAPTTKLQRTSEILSFQITPTAARAINQIQYLLQVWIWEDRVDCFHAENISCKQILVIRMLMISLIWFQGTGAIQNQWVTEICCFESLVIVVHACQKHACIAKSSHTYTKIYIGKYDAENGRKNCGHMKFAPLKITQPWLSLPRLSFGYIAVSTLYAFHTESATEAQRRESVIKFNGLSWRASFMYST